MNSHEVIKRSELSKKMAMKYPRVCAAVDLDAILSNMRSMHEHLDKKTMMIAVIKTDGYGFGAVPIAGLLEKEDYIWGYASATVEEAMELRENGIKKPILILGYTFPFSYDTLIDNDIRPAVFRDDQLEQLEERAAYKAANGIGGKVKVHIAVDTSMARIGVRPDDYGASFVRKALSMEHIEVEGIFTHFARADEKDLSDAYDKRDIFESFVKRVEKENNVRIPLHHCANSASIISIPTAQMDMVRAGVTMYGMRPSDEVPTDIVKITPALGLYSHIAYIKDVPKGVAVSYGGTFVTDKPTKIATIPVGYGDGYPRSLSNKGYVLINGIKAPILGRVCMDQFMVDVSDIENVSENDEVTLIGWSGQSHISIEELGNLSGRFNYELACDLNPRIPRLYIQG